MERGKLSATLPRPATHASGPAEGGSRRLPALVSVAVAITVLVGLAVTLLAPPRAFGSWLGVPLPPFFAFWRPAVSGWSLVAALVLFAAAASAGRLRSAVLGPLGFAAAAFALALGLRLALATSAQGPRAWAAIFGGTRGQNEYLPALSALELGAHTFLDRFAEVALTLPLHPSAHPPGTILTLHLLGIDSANGMAALTIATGALAAPLTYALGRALLDERGARTAALLLAFAPSALLYGATSADAMFATLAVAAAALLAARAGLARVLGAIALALASFFSWALLAIGAWAALLRALQGGLLAAARLSTLCAAALVAFYAGLYALTGFDPLGTLAAANQAYRAGIYFGRPYWYWLFGSPAAFLVALGLPLAWLALRAMAARQAAALALVGVVVTAAVLGFSKAETERIWLFMVPLACVAAATQLEPQRLPAVLGLLAAQALAVEILLGTVW